ncbi:MAG: phage holin family protein [Nanoarchaeota archaeon]
MRPIARLIAINSLSLFLTSIFLPGLQITGGFMSFTIAGTLFAIALTILDPIIKVITLPFNILTLGLLSFLSTLAALFLISFIYGNVTVSAFTFEGFAFWGIEIQRIQLSYLLSLLVISATIYILNKVIDSLFS